jgi:D-alanyl-D-alanine carboxypeptidase/D-alanyl-D-alanine-endopeptidase (penicillin-binding protein 4)
LILFIALPCEGQFRFDPAFKVKNQEFVFALEKFRALMSLQGASIGIAIKDAESGKLLASLNPKTNLIPASNQKLITSLNGLKNLGPDFTFKTKIWAAGEIKEGKLVGDLLIEGVGDPTIYSQDREKFKDNFFKKLIRLLENAGIKKIVGKLKIKEKKNPYEGIRADWAWIDIGNYFGAGIYPLNINENQYALFLSATSEGSAAKIKKRDSISDVEIIKEEVVTDSPGTPDLAYIYWIPGTKGAKIQGSLPKDNDQQKVRGAIQNPEFVFFEVLKSELKKAGIEVLEQAPANGNNQLIGNVDSPPLKEIIKEVNIFSNNLMTESIAYALANDQDKLDESGWTQLARFPISFSCPQGFYFSDACGLSLSNRISPEGFSNALVWAKKQPFFNDFYNSLPVSGESGTMKKFCNSPAAKGKIRAKSGTLTRVMCYSGYARSKTSELAFSIMINSYSGQFKPMKAELGKLMEKLVDIK